MPTYSLVRFCVYNHFLVYLETHTWIWSCPPSFKGWHLHHVLFSYTHSGTYNWLLQITPMHLPQCSRMYSCLCYTSTSKKNMPSSFFIFFKDFKVIVLLIWSFVNPALSPLLSSPRRKRKLLNFHPQRTKKQMKEATWWHIAIQMSVQSSQLVNVRSNKRIKTVNGM